VSTGSGSLSIWVPNAPGKQLQTLNCPAESGCKITIALPNQTVGADPKSMSAKLRALGDFLAAPEIPEMAVSRGLEAQLINSVLLLASAGVELAPALEGMPEGQYWIAVESLGTHQKIVMPVKVQWRPGEAVVIWDVHLKPGLYSLIQTDQTGMPVDSQAWILVCDAKTYGQRAADYKNAVELSRQWTDADAAAVQVLLHAYMESLSEARSN
jgi:hypothetical protein